MIHRIIGARSDQAARRTVKVAIAAVVAFAIIASVGYRLIEPGYTWLDALYMTMISITTVGYTEVGGRLTTGGRVWTMFVILGGLTTGTVALSLIVTALVEGRIRSILGRRQLERKIAALSGHVIVCGYGRMGQRVAIKLRESGRDVVIVDNDAQRTTQAEQDGMLYLLGDAEEECTLLAAGIGQASALAAALTNDATNVFLTLSARVLNSSLRIIARAQDAATQDKLIKAGATRVVCPQTLGGNRMADVLLRPALVDFVEMAHKGVDLEMDQLTISDASRMAGRTLRDLSLPSRVGATVVAIRRPGCDAIYNPGPDVPLSAGDTLILIGKRGVAGAIEAIGDVTEQ